MLLLPAFSKVFGSLGYSASGEGVDGLPPNADGGRTGGCDGNVALWSVLVLGLQMIQDMLQDDGFTCEFNGGGSVVSWLIKY